MSEEPDLSQDTEMDRVRVALRRVQINLPGALRYRVQNTLDHLDRAFLIFDIDREMASFRAITAQEEAATALILCIQLRKYDSADRFNPRDHQHKAAVMACVLAVGSVIAPILPKFQLLVDPAFPRIDIKVPLSNFGVAGGEEYALQPVEPLDLLHTQDGVSESELFTDALHGLAKRSKFENIKKLVAAQANARNTLLYASDGRVPTSEATVESLRQRQTHAVALLILTVMVWQTKHEQALVRHAIKAFLGVISRLPKPGSA